MSKDTGATVLTPIGVPFLHAELDVDDVELKAQRERSGEIVESNDNGWGAEWADDCGSWNSVGIYGSILEEEEVYAPILEDLGDLLTEFTNAMRMDWSGMTSMITESWLNANPPGNVQECHTHPHCYVACVYYIHVPEGDGGEFVLDNPLSYEHDVGCDSLSPYTDKTIDVKSGDLIMFPSNIEHHTRVNLSNEYRYSLAFNISTEELLPAFQLSDGGAPWDTEQ
jgi:uncharacterized protein (TIGR02466 family)